MDLRRLRFLRINGVYIKNLDRLVWLLREKYPKVLEADRRFEEETLYRNKLGTNNLVDALSHIGTLFESAPGGSLEEQRAQITLFEDHLRRTMMEAWEQMLDFQLGEIDELWETVYLELARPLQVEGLLPGAPSHNEIDRLRLHYKRQLDRGRAYKRGPGWDEWESGTDLLIDACLTASQLREKLDESIAAAKKHQTDKERNATASSRHEQTLKRDSWNKVLAVIGIVLAITGGIGLASILGIGGDTKTRTITTQATTPTATVSRPSAHPGKTKPTVPAKTTP
jgi:hypothetical protein